ncbi:DUF1631 domain-containing protein [Marinobacter mangrovi]|uniref:DUF1631 domain-containing protein n=1 Tax=Marinobacter mangrovi TaxID=2803918 RepID=UPI00193253EC|nr:DUF1631 domain-containing protein [Marinobacter mangrovi]
MTNDNRVVSLHGGMREGSFSLPSALIRLRDYSGQSLRKELGEFFDSADDALFNLADKAGTNQDQTAYFDAMRELRLRRKAMSLSILQWVARAFNDIGTFDPQSRSGDLTEIDQDSLSLVDHGDHEQQVAIDNLVNKLRNRYADSIRMLATRIAHLIPKANLADRQMPLSPEVICGGLQEACNDLDIDIRAKLVVLKLFDKLFIDRLDRLYRDANTLLVKDGVLPDMKRPPIGGRAEPRQPVARRPVPPSTSAPADDVYTPVDQDSAAQPTFSELSALLHTQGGQGSSSSSAGGQQRGGIDTVELMRRLAQLQSQSDVLNADHHFVESDIAGGNLTRQVETMLAGHNQSMGALNQVDADVVNLVTMLFDFILEDRQLPLPMKNVIGRLQIPILKVALLDRSFFNRGGHPARKLLNELAMAGIGWNEKPAGQRDPLREKIESVVDRLISDFTDNVDIFGELLTEFSHFMDLDRRRRELVEQRLRDAEEGRARQERAREAASEVLEPLRNGRNLPPVVESILDEPWSKVLQFLYLREGEASDAWKQSVALAGELVWSVDPQEVTDETRSELLRRIPSIVDSLRKGLHSISWDPFASDAMMRDLELAHVDTLQQLAVQAPEARQAAPEPVEAAETPDDAALASAVAEFSQPQPAKPVEPGAEVVEPPRAPESIETDSAPVSQEDGVDSRWLEMAQKLRVGSWVELQSEGQKLRCKLAAVIKATGKYIFVNRNGAKVAEYAQADVAKALSTGEVSMLDDGLIFDRALESIIDNLRHSRRD